MTSFQRERLACAYFFAIPGLMYGVFTARLPAIKQMINGDDSQVGILLLAFGLASLAGLLASGQIIRRFGIRHCMGIAAILFPAWLTIAALAYAYWFLIAFCLLAGFCGGLCEVAMNAQGIDIEKRYHKLCMASLHACFSLGGVAGSLAGSLFAGMGASPFHNFLAVALGYLLAWPLAFGSLGHGAEIADAATGRQSGKLPLFIYLCSLVSMLCYISEGSVGDWGSILLHSVKGAPQSLAALAFGSFCTTMVIFRFLGDRLRRLLGDFRIVLFGSTLGFICMSTVLLTSSPYLCLAAYAGMGAGFAPIVPILFSRAGGYPGVDAARASSVVSIMSYSGLLVFSPLVGMLGDAIGLARAFWLVPLACFLIMCSSPLLLQKP